MRRDLGGEERLPKDSLWIGDKTLVGLVIAAHECLAEHVDAALPVVLKGSGHPFRRFELDSKMIEAGLIAMSVDADVELRILELPFGLIRLSVRRLGARKVGVEFDRAFQVLDLETDMNAPHRESAFFCVDRTVRHAPHCQAATSDYVSCEFYISIILEICQQNNAPGVEWA